METVKRSTSVPAILVMWLLNVLFKAFSVSRQPTILNSLLKLPTHFKSYLLGETADYIPSHDSFIRNPDGSSSRSGPYLVYYQKDIIKPMSIRMKTHYVELCWQFKNPNCRRSITLAVAWIYWVLSSIFFTDPHASACRKANKFQHESARTNRPCCTIHWKVV